MLFIKSKNDLEEIVFLELKEDKVVNKINKFSLLLSS